MMMLLLMVNMTNKKKKNNTHNMMMMMMMMTMMLTILVDITAMAITMWGIISNISCFLPSQVFDCIKFFSRSSRQPKGKQSKLSSHQNNWGSNALPRLKMLRSVWMIRCKHISHNLIHSIHRYLQVMLVEYEVGESPEKKSLNMVELKI